MAGITDVLFGAAKEVGSAGVDLGKALLSIPTSVATAIPDFVNNPDVFINESGRLDPRSIGALFSRDYRKKRAEELDTANQNAAAMQKLDRIDKGLGIVKSIFGQPLGATVTDQGRQQYGNAITNVLPDFNVSPYQAGAQAEHDAARQAAAAAGASPELTNIADINSAQKIGQTEFSAGQTRETQRRAFGQRKQLQDERLQAQREAQTQRLAASQNAPGGIPSTGAERRDQKNVEALRQALAANAIPEASIPLAQSAVDAGSGSLALQVLTQSGYAAGRRDSSRVLQDKGFVEARNRANNAAKTLETMRSVQQVASTPDGAGIDPSLFSPAMALTLPEDADRLSVALSVMNPDFAQRKQALMSTAGKASQQYILDMTGKVSNVNELNRIRNVAPNGNEASGALFVSKMRAFNSALQREQQTAEREAQAIAEAIRNGDWKGTLPGGIAAGLQAERDASLRQLADDLSSATTNPDLHSDAPLTEAERQDLEKYGYGK